MKISKCLQCGVTIEYNSSQKRGKYCSNKCQQDYRYKTITIPKIKAGKGIRGIRRYLIEIYGEICSECKLEPMWNGKRLLLHLDHIDGDRTNNNVENLRLLCPNCHSQTETYAGRNNGNTGGTKVTDALLVSSLSSSKSVCSALNEVGMAISGPNYKRCYKLLAEHQKSIAPLF